MPERTAKTTAAGKRGTSIRDRDLDALPIACNLTGREASQRKESTIEVLRRAEQAREIEDGYELLFPGDDEMVRGITEVVIAERSCCPFLAFETLFEPDGGPVLLRVSGPPGAKDFIRDELAMTTIEE
ncbi:MAG TPA: hypothetical protein VFJ72_04175 [Rubrobacteraceae bacterium]|nr:hypothetical protein [Rubrobacteraceae bacterium]